MMTKQPDNTLNFLRKYTFLALAVWTVLVSLLLYLEMSLHRDELVTIARHEAETVFTRDLQFRKWNATHGGVYVPMSKDSPPNPYLADVPERDLVTPSGRKLTLINPAYMTRQVYERGRKETGIWGHITSLKPLRPQNAPDEWERKALLAFERGKKEFSSVETADGKQYLRFMRPLITDEACLKCHGRQGYKKGDIRGGISVMVPLHDFWSIFYLSMRDNLIGYGLLWLTGTIAVVVTSRRFGEKTVRIIEDENKYRILFNTAHDAIFMTEAESGIVLDANKRAGELAGMPVEAIAGMNLIDLHPEDDRQRYAELFRKVVEQGESCSAVLSLSASDGRAVPVEVSAAPGETGGKRIVQLLYKDITENRKAEAEREDLINKLQTLVTQISSSQKEWEETFDSITDVIFISDTECNIVRANRALERFLDLPFEKILYRKCHSLFQWMQPSPEGCSSCASVKAGLPSTLECFDQKLQRCVEVTVLSRLGSGREAIGLIHIVRDITEHKRLHEQLNQAQKMEAVGQLAGGVAHDFNNVLTAIISCASLLNIKLEKENQLRSYVDHILSSSRRGADLVKGLLAFSRKQVFYPAMLDLNDLVRGLEGLLRTTITEEIELKVKISGDVLPIMADKTSMEQALINLFANARDAMPSGGSITISTDRLKLDSEFVKTCGSLRPGEYAFLSVSDTGEGMPEDIKARVFEPFFTTKEVGKGTGLGLSIIYGIVEQHGGHISLDSMSGLGTSVKIYLPVAAGGDTGSEEVVKSIPEGGSEIVLFAEDNAVLREIIVNLLEEFGYTVLAAVDGEHAMTIFDQNKDKIGLLVLDVIMPKMDGRQVYKEIIRVRPGIKTIFMSSYNTDILQEKFMPDQGQHFLLKPISPDRFLEKIREVLDA